MIDYRLQSPGISYSISSLVAGMQSSPVLVARSQTQSVNITEGSQTASPPGPLPPHQSRLHLYPHLILRDLMAQGVHK
ncbi:hypothetical protein AZE42_09280 [Rhizopogon vesiculosus]|uniref:Uncharacterized protein n=1 Tax=Rhizopogon vesiculosus TaxID=180088 RepID=A0A1J8Q3C9_9AGAM|nr:hypothetical protein AZE42_09280 [Rhizopogon vesiculosus]